MAQNRNGGLRKLCGCPHKKWPTCRHSWHFSFQWRRVHYRFSLDRHLGQHVVGKTEARAEADKVGAAIRRGQFAPVQTDETPSAPKRVTFDAFSDLYLERALSGRRNDVSRLKRLCAFVFKSGERLGSKPLEDVTEDDLEVFWDSLRVEGLAASTRNKYVQILKAMFRWAVRKGYLARNPISEDSALKREKHARRARRLVGDEEQRLIAAAPPRLQRLILGALESGARLGELLSLLWKDVDLARREITIRATNAKNKENRHIPISTRLGAVLEMGRFDPAGVPFGPEDHVFGDEVGRRLRTTQKAWQTAILKANGHTPQWHPRTKRLQPESQAVYQAVDLRFHDLRHEAGSRWLEAGMSIHHVKALLGHASHSTTDIYLNATRVGLHEAMQRVDAKRTTGTLQPMPTAGHRDAAVVN